VAGKNSYFLAKLQIPKYKGAIAVTAKGLVAVWGNDDGLCYSRIASIGCVPVVRLEIPNTEGGAVCIGIDDT
jgi:hypothetical protein